ncbi:MAG: hypothetical protein Q8S31_10135 [Alphaproteobacteria bacterium]|nr:hypothetical protein [Alphaproteobacteria bacterium]
MSLQIKTFDNKTGASALFKAIGHPYCVPKTHDLIKSLASVKDVAIYDPLDQIETFNALYSLEKLPISQIFVQNIDEIGVQKLGKTAQPIVSLKECRPDVLFVLAYDAKRLVDHIKYLVDSKTKIVTLDDIRLPDDFMSNPKNYLDPHNFATNFAFFRDDEESYTRLFTANYWAGWGAQNISVWCSLIDHQGKVLAEWRELIPHKGQTIVFDSREIRERFKLDAFTGQLFIHVLGAKGHDTVKYALDVVSKKDQYISATHDANSFPADYYAGLPAPADNEKVVFWVQNSHPTPIPAGTIGFNVMGDENTKQYFSKDVPGFGTYALDLHEVLPNVKWPQQIEIHAKKYFVRPRYEIVNDKNIRRIAHANVERTDLNPDPKIADLSNLMGKAYILSAPILPMKDFKTIALPTPMVRSQMHLPLVMNCYDAKGNQIATKSLGNLKRNHQHCIDLDDLKLNSTTDYGHVEFIYDFQAGKEADGWIHGLFRYQNRQSGQQAETSFGSHIYNTVLTYKTEPQSYAGPAPGLSTRLFLRLGGNDVRSFCHLMYPVSTPFHAYSNTDLFLHNQNGVEVASTSLKIPASGSQLWFYDEVFSEAQRQEAGVNAYIMIRDTTCRLFGYHGMTSKNGGLSLDHMFGF